MALIPPPPPPERSLSELKPTLLKTHTPDRRILLSDAAEGIFRSCLVTFDIPGCASLDAVLVPYSGHATAVTLCVQPQGETRPVYPEQVRHQMGNPPESIEGLTEMSLWQGEWRCPRCNASLDDWGNTISEYSGGISFHSVPAEAPRSATDPAPHRMLRRALAQNGQQDVLLEMLQRWRPRLYREVLSSLHRWDRDRIQLATALRRLSTHMRQEEFMQAMRSIMFLQLVGLRLSSRLGAGGFGLATCWPTVIHFVHGVKPVNGTQLVWPLLRLVSPQLPDIESRREWSERVYAMMARRVPHPPMAF